MCEAIEYYLDGERHEARYTRGKTELPIRLRGGSIKFERWGVLGPEYLADDNKQGWGAKFPETGWARLDDIRRHQWARMEPQPVKIMASRFAVSDRTWHRDRWFPLQRGQFIQGLLAKLGIHRRVYVVTVPRPAEIDIQPGYFDVWPRVVGAGVPS